MTRALSILAPTRYPWRFNSPRHSRHRIENRTFLPLNKISKKIEAFTVLNPFPLKRFDLIHTFNRIPLNRIPYLINFESHLPRAYGLYKTRYYRWLCASLLGNRCRGIIAISEYAKRQFLHQHRNQPWRDALAAKVIVRYPNLPIPETPDRCTDDTTWRLVFVGAHFVRKGGLVALRIAEMAHARNLPITLDIVSALEESWVDPLLPGYMEPYRALLQRLPNVRQHGSLPNAQVLDLVAAAHFSLLPTFSDSFGFSVIESMAQHTPAIVTAQCALPEIVTHRHNGVLLPMNLTPQGEWEHIVHPARDSEEYAGVYNRETDRLAALALEEITALMADKPAYRAMRAAARADAKARFDSQDANRFWDELYEKSVAC